MMDGNAALLQQLRCQMKPFPQMVSFSRHPGIYAVYFVGQRFPSLAAHQISAGTLIYIGKTEDSQIARDLHQHFASGETGHSTLRRSFAALLLSELSLKPVPRSFTETSDRRFTNFRLDDASEDRLTVWMKANLGLSFFEMPGSSPVQIEAMETGLINEAVPILNIKGNRKNGCRSALQTARGRCAELARRNCRMIA